MSKPLEVSLSLPYDALVEALSDLGVDEFVALIKAVDEKLADWELISNLKPWTDAEHRKMAEEETEDLATKTDRCTRSAEYDDIWFHVSPHKGCILR